MTSAEYILVAVLFGLAAVFGAIWVGITIYLIKERRKEAGHDRKTKRP